MDIDVTRKYNSKTIKTISATKCFTTHWNDSLLALATFQLTIRGWRAKFIYVSRAYSLQVKKYPCLK